MIQVVVDDIAFVRADAVIRPATSRLEPTTPSLRRLEQVGGAGFWSQLSVQQELAVGAAVVTGAGDLPAEFVIHAIIKSDTEPITGASVHRAIVSALQRAADWQIAHLTVPPLGTGAGNLSLEDAADVMCQALAVQTESAFPNQVTIVVETEEEKLVFDGYLQRLGR